MKELYVIVNDKFYNEKKYFFCENKDIQSILNYFSTRYNLIVFSRYSKSFNPFKLNKIYNILNFRFIKIFNFIIFFFNLKKNKKRVLIISITPFNFIIFIIFQFFFNCKFYLYLRSNGYEEYNSILGKRYVWIYHLMFKYITKHSEVISCHKRLYKKKCHILYPSELSLNWEKNLTKNYFKNNLINITYVGRLKIEKGIYSLLSIFSKLPENIRLTLVGSGDFVKKINNRIKIINFVNNENKLINLYDLSNIIILPSYTEAHPKVIDEALARMRPVIVFDDIKYVINKRNGVFSSKRDPKELIKLINFIKKKNHLISSQLKKNKLPKKEVFLKNLYKIISKA
jgi:glycosyltransferase involved in cell wall biosynthesis